MKADEFKERLDTIREFLDARGPTSTILANYLDLLCQERLDRKRESEEEA